MLFALVIVDETLLVVDVVVVPVNESVKSVIDVAEGDDVVTDDGIEVVALDVDKTDG